MHHGISESEPLAEDHLLFHSEKTMAFVNVNRTKEKW